MGLTNDWIVAIDFGSTYTKVALIDLNREEVAGVGRASSTVATDVNEGLRQALDQLWRSLPEGRRVHTALGCSSAAGGLRVVVVGLVPALSLEAARRAALGAGAKLVGAFGYKLTERDLRAIDLAAPDIVLLAGGTDGGDEETISHNAAALASGGLGAPIVVAGNRVVAPRCAEQLRAAGKDVFLTENLLPELDRVNAEPVRAVIRDLFMTRIVRAKGIDRAEESLARGIVPTPAAVLRAAEVLALGTEAEPGLGDLVVVDVGGATTDVHSVAEGRPEGEVLLKGLPEPRVKRTVEGDLGLRVNASTLLERASHGVLAEWTVGLAAHCPDVRAYVERVTSRTDYVPGDGGELALDAALARAAVSLAMDRHAGTLRDVYTPAGSVRVQQGKDLRGVGAVIGTGGVFASGAYPRFVLEGSALDRSAPFSLRPREPRFHVDRAYVLYAIGLLADVDPGVALRVAKKQLLPV